MSQSKASIDGFGAMPSDVDSLSSSRASVDDAPFDGSTGTDDGATQKLERIRDLLFGETSRAHEDRASLLEATMAAELTRLSERMDARFDELRTELLGQIAALDARLDLQGREKVEREDVRTWLTDLAGRLGAPSTDSGRAESDGR